MFDALAELERLGSGAVLRMAARYEEAGAWKRNGARSPEDDIARKTGSGTTRARRKLSTSKRLRQQPKTDDAVRQGRVSTDQADEVSEGASVAPDAEDALLDIDHNLGWTLTHNTRTEDLSWLCWHCHDIKTRHDLYLVGPVGNERLVRRDGSDWDPPPEDDPPGNDPPPAQPPREWRAVGAGQRLRSTTSPDGAVPAPSRWRLTVIRG